MRKFILGIIFTTIAICPIPNALSKSIAPESGTSQLSAQDLSTADGSCRVGLHDEKFYCILTSTDTDIQLTPNSWSSAAEPQQWNAWLVDFDDALFARWTNACPVNGQGTVEVHITPNNIAQGKGQFLAAATDSTTNRDQIQRDFESAIQKSLEQTFKASTSMPSTKHPLKEVRLALTFMRDVNSVPRYGKREFGFVATVVPATKKIIVYSRTKDGRSPGIQIIGDGDGGSIQPIESDVFARKCDEIDSPRGD